MSKVDRIVLCVRDFEGCVGSYRDKLKLRIKAIRGDSAAFELGSDQTLHLISLSKIAETVREDVIQSDENPPRRTILGMYVDDVEETRQTLEERRVEFVKAGDAELWGERLAYFADPDGNLWAAGLLVSCRESSAPGVG